MDPLVGDVYDSVNEVGDVRLQNPSGGDLIGELMAEEMDMELQAFALEQEDLKQCMMFQQQKIQLLLMRAHAQDLRHDLEGQQNHEKYIGDHTSCCNDSCGKRHLQREVTTSGYGQSGQNGSVELSSLLHRLRNDKQLEDQMSRTMNSLGVVEGDTDSDQDEELQEQASFNGKHSKKKSGLLEKSQDNVIKTVVWPHLRLGVRYSTARNMDFDQLDL